MLSKLKKMTLTEYALKILGTIGSITSMIGVLPQIIENYRKRKGVRLSKILMGNLITGSSSWTLYGIIKGDFFLTLGSGFATLFQIILVIQNIYYLKKEENDRPDVIIKN